MIAAMVAGVCLSDEQPPDLPAHGRREYLIALRSSSIAKPPGQPPLKGLDLVGILGHSKRRQSLFEFAAQRRVILHPFVEYCQRLRIEMSEDDDLVIRDRLLCQASCGENEHGKCRQESNVA